MKDGTSFLLDVATRYRGAAFFMGAIVALSALETEAIACPFCSVESQTLSEETQSADAVVLAKLVKEAPPINDAVGGFGDPDAGMATFQVIEALRGADLLPGVREIEVVFFGEPDREQVFLISGIGTEKIDWTTPLPLSAAAVDYVRKLAEVPASGPDRLAFFQQHLEHEDPLLAQDAYDEFARTPYADVQALGPRMPHDRLVKWIADPEISPSRRRLYLTMLGVCGTAEDIPLLEAMIASDFQAMQPQLERLVRCGLAMGGPIGLPLWIDLVDQDERRKKLGLDAMVACYLTLHGPEGLDLIDERFLKNPNTEYTYTYSTIMALRFHGEEETSPVPRERLLASMRLLLDNSEFADQVIPDLARWEDWSVLDRLVAMFKAADENGYIRQPVVTYLTVASEQPGDVGARATTALAELESLDPEGVKSARSLMAFGALGRARASSEGSGATRPDSDTADASSVAESETAEPLDESEIPDPAAYSKSEETSEPSARESDATQDALTAVTAKKVNADKSPAAEAASPGPVAETVEADFNPALAVGVPLAAALLLMGLYWVILRSGAV